MAERQSVYDTENFFESYQKLRANPVSLNNIVEKPTMLSLLPDLTGKKLLDLGCGSGEHLRLYLERGAGFVTGVDLSAAMLRLNPKAWLAAVAGMGAFVSGGEATLIWAFALIYFVVCYLSVACWAYTGAFLSRYLHSTRRIRLFNRAMAAMLASCAVSLLWF